MNQRQTKQHQLKKPHLLINTHKQKIHKWKMLKENCLKRNNSYLCPTMKQVYLILAAMLLLCLAPMPYGYFMLVRFVAMAVFGLMAYRYIVAEKLTLAYVFGALALLFQPFFKIALGRFLWNVVDVVVAVLLITLFVMEKRLERK